MNSVKVQHKSDKPDGIMDRFYDTFQNIGPIETIIISLGHKVNCIQSRSIRLSICLNMGAIHWGTKKIEHINQKVNLKGQPVGLPDICWWCRIDILLLIDRFFIENSGQQIRSKIDNFQNANFLISQPTPMVWPLIWIVSERRFQWGSQHRDWLRNEKVNMKTVLFTFS